MTDSKNPANKDKSESDRLNYSNPFDFDEQSDTRLHVRNTFEPPTRTEQGNKNDDEESES